MRISDWSSDVCSSDLIAGVAGQDRRRPRVVDAHAFVAALLFVALVIVGVIDLAQPFGDLAVRSVYAQALAVDRQVASLEPGLDVAPGNRQHAALARPPAAEIGRELPQRRRPVSRPLARAAFGIGQRAAAFVLDV